MAEVHQEASYINDYSEKALMQHLIFFQENKKANSTLFAWVILSLHLSLTSSLTFMRD